MLGFIGAGKMAEAVLAGILRKGDASPEAIRVSDKVETRVRELVGRYGIQGGSCNEELVLGCDPIVLAVKPQDLDPVLKEIAKNVVGKCVISIAAGRLIESLESALPGARIVRVMPNLACQVGAGMSVVCGGSLATGRDVEMAEHIFGASGVVCQAPEEQFDMVTAVSGSGPAFWAQLAAYECKKACEAGLRAETARLLVLQTMLGAAKVLLEGGMDFEEFMDAVASKGGTTAAGLDVLRNRPAAAILEDVLEAAAARSRALQR